MIPLPIDTSQTNAALKTEDEPVVEDIVDQSSAAPSTPKKRGPRPEAQTPTKKSQVSEEEVDEARVLDRMEEKKVRDEVLACPMGGPATFSTIFQAVQLPHIGSPIYLLPLLQSLCLQSPQSCLHSTVSLPSGVETANMLVCLGINFEGRGSLVAPPPIVCLPVLRAMFLVSPFIVICWAWL